MTSWEFLNLRSVGKILVQYMYISITETVQNCVNELTGCEDKWTVNITRKKVTPVIMICWAY